MTTSVTITNNGPHDVDVWIPEATTDKRDVKLTTLPAGGRVTANVWEPNGYQLLVKEATADGA